MSMNKKNKEDRLSKLMKYALQGDWQDETLDELKAAAFEVLLQNPGCEQCDWVNILVEQYGTELVDAYGNNPEEVYASLADLWESPYYDNNSGLEYDYQTWAEALWTEASVQMYYDLTANKNKG